MRSPKYNYDPAPPGKYPIDRILVDSDLDGIVSAAILLQVYPDAEVILGDPSLLNQGAYDKLVTSSTAILDLKYIKGAGLYFDHHISNKPAKGSRIPGVWRSSESTVTIVYDYYKDHFDLKKFEKYLDDICKFDLGNITLKEIQKMTLIIKIGLMINRDNEDFNRHLVFQFAINNLPQIARDSWVSKEIDVHDRNYKKFLLFFAKNHNITRNIGFVDMTKFSHGHIHSYLIVNQMPKVDVLVLTKGTKENLRYNLYKNNFKKRKIELDLLKIAKIINPENSGGHKVACGFPSPGSMTREAVQARIIELIEKQRKGKSV